MQTIYRPERSEKNGYSGPVTALVVVPDADETANLHRTLKENGIHRYIGPDGSLVIANQFICERAMAGPFRDGLARVAKNGRWGHINRDAQSHR